MTESQRGRLEIVAGPIGFVALLLVAVPVFDLFANVWPLRPGSLHWRFGTSGLLSGFLLTPLLGLALLTVVAAFRARRATLLALTLANGLGALLLFALVPLFILDFLQLRGTVPPVEKALFDASGVKAVVKHAACALALLGLTLGNLRLWKAARAKQRAEAPARGVLVVAPPESAAAHVTAR
jgi:hypothetical protein